MITSKISSEYQIVIPSQIRESLDIKPGQSVQIIQYLGRIEVIPIKPISEMRGFLKGININFEREDDRI